jgi:hypothetical protein
MWNDWDAAVTAGGLPGPGTIALSFIGPTISGTAPTDHHHSVPGYEIQNQIDDAPTTWGPGLYEPDYILMEIGANDCAEPTFNAATTAALYVTLINLLTSLLPNLQGIGLAFCHPIGGTPPPRGDNINAFNYLLPDVWSELKAQNPTIPIYIVDSLLPNILGGLHPNDAGCITYAQRSWYPALRYMLGYPLPS